MKKLFLVSLIVVLSTPVQAANWVLVSNDITGRTFYIDTETTIIKGNNISVWLKTRALDESYAIGNWLYDCKAMRTRRIIEYIYSSNGLLNRTDGLMSWLSLPPDSAGVTIWRSVCFIRAFELKTGRSISILH